MIYHHPWKYIGLLDKEIEKTIAEETENGLTGQAERNLHALLENRKHIIEMFMNPPEVEAVGMAATLECAVEAKASTWVAQAIEDEIEAAEDYYRQWQCTSHQVLKAICTDKLNHAEALLKLASEAEKAEVSEAVNALHGLKKKLTS